MDLLIINMYNLKVQPKIQFILGSKNVFRKRKMLVNCRSHCRAVGPGPSTLFAGRGGDGSGCSGTTNEAVSVWLMLYGDDVLDSFA